MECLYKSTILEEAPLPITRLEWLELFYKGGPKYRYLCRIMKDVLQEYVIEEYFYLRILLTYFGRGGVSCLRGKSVRSTDDRSVP